MILRLYLRRSKGDDHQMHSLDVQRDSARSFVSSHLVGQLGLSPALWDQRVEYVDDDRSRTDFEGREQLARLRKEVQPGDVIVTRDQSRIGGDALDVTVVVRELVQRRRTRLFYYASKTEIPYSGVMDSVRTFVEGVGSQMEVENIRSRTREHLRNRVALGRIAGGRCFGYRLVQMKDASGRRSHTIAVVDEAQAAIVRRVFDEARAGKGFGSIAAGLNADGHRNASGVPWTGAAIRVLLTNDRYRGLYIHGRMNRRRIGKRRIAERARPDEILIVEVPEWRIVDDVAWHAVQAQFKARARGPNAVGPATKYPLSGIARCGHCGGPIGVPGRTVISLNGQRIRVATYSCIGHRQKKGCPVTVMQPIDEVEGALADFVSENVLTPSVIERFMAGMRAEVERQTHQPGEVVADLEKRLARLDKEQRNLARAVAAGGDEIPALVDELRTRQREIQDLRVRLETARRAPTERDGLVEKVETALRAKLADLRTALAGDRQAARDAYAALFPKGLTFTPAALGPGPGPSRARRVWAISGMAHLGCRDLMVTPPGLEPGTSP